MTEFIGNLSEEEDIAIDKLLLKGKRIQAIKSFIDATGQHVGESKVVIGIRQTYLCEVGLAEMKDRECIATDKGKAWLVGHGEESFKLNPKRHFYLYAKGHYERSGDMIADLKQIAHAYCGNDVSEDDLLILIGSEAYQYVNENTFIKMLREASPNSLRSTVFLKGGSYAVRILSQLLNLLSAVEVKKQDASGEFQWIINLGDPDPDILPLRKGTIPSPGCKRLICASLEPERR